MLSAVATRYAQALVDVVMAAGSTLSGPKALSELRSIAELISGSVDLRNALLSPAVSPSRKRAVASKLTGPMSIHPQIRNFLFVVIDHRRVHELSSMVEAFEVLLDERLGYIRADVSSAHPLSEGEQASIETQLSRLSGKKARPRFTTDPALVGGIVARLGSTVYDGSVRGQLERLRAKLASG